MNFIPNKHFNNPSFDSFLSINIITTYVCQTSYLKEVAPTFFIMYDFYNMPIKEVCEEMFLAESGW